MAMKLVNQICTAVVLWAAAEMILPAQTVTTLFSFGETNGAQPLAGLVQGTDGYLYGTTQLGGINCAPNGCGTVFKVSPGGTLKTLYSFCAFYQCLDGATPLAGLVQTASNEFYGTTIVGGSSSYCPNSPYSPGCGTIFKITPQGALTVLYNFCSQSGCADGAYPFAGLVQATNGDLYGTTDFGGANNAGTIFKITASGSLTTLYSFCSITGCADGAFPQAGLVQAANGDLYGTTTSGGANATGTVFKATLSGALTTLYSFCAQSGCTDGSYPHAGLVQAANEELYGTTASGGASNQGTVFKIGTSGAFTTLHSFSGVDGAGPMAALVQATNGNLYGTTSAGGDNNGNNGTIFQITQGGTLTTVYNFCVLLGCPALPDSPLVQDTNGNLYSTSLLGGTDQICSGLGCGTVFSLSIGLGPFVRLQPVSGKVGSLIQILGTDLTGATAVSFNGTAAVFKTVSNTLIWADVPAGATSGKVQVTTPGGTLVSNVSFHVHP
jgi:uncharacterized repeat protein (TIGR03803 family)